VLGNLSDGKKERKQPKKPQKTGPRREKESLAAEFLTHSNKGLD
jgi:hypothetical protein